MPWSDWYEYGDATRGAGERVTLEFSTQYGNTAYRNSDPAQVDGYAFPDIDRHTRHGHQWAVPYDWRTWRDWFPPLLWDMQEGVDYAANPDTGDYVEYEPGVDNTLLGWVMPTPYLSQAYALDVPDVNTMAWELGIATGTSYAVGSLGGWPGSGSVFASGVDTVPDGTDLPAPADPGPVERFTLLGDVTAVNGTQGYFSVRFRSDPMVRLHLPRFRYWKLTESVFPLRQKQRNDGLGRGVFRARGTSSVQNSVRQRGYR